LERNLMEGKREVGSWGEKEGRNKKEKYGWVM
jgi:hypothetical protein